MGKVKTVKAEQLPPVYEADCPHCKETMYSDYCNDWDTAEMMDMDLAIECTECSKKFNVSY